MFRPAQRTAVAPRRFIRQNVVLSTAVPYKPPSTVVDFSAIQELEDLAAKLNLDPPIYKPSGGTSSGGGYFCSVKVHGHIAGSLDEYVSPQAAQCAAAANALKLLKTYYADKLFPQSVFNFNASDGSSSDFRGAEQMSSYFVAADSDQITVSDEELEMIVDNLLTLLNDVPRGIFNHKLAEIYQETYKQRLPHNWLARLKEGFPEIVVEEVDGFRSIVCKRSSANAVPRPFVEAVRIEKAINAAGEAEDKGAVSASSLSTDIKKSSTDDDPVKNLPPVSQLKVDEISLAITENLTVTGSENRKSSVRFKEEIEEHHFEPHPDEDVEIIQAPPLDCPPTYLLPDKDEWRVFVSVIKSPSDFIVRIDGVDHSLLFEQLQREMHNFYEENRQGRKIKIGAGLDYDALANHFYVARAEECWHRVYLLEVIPADEGIADERGRCTASVYFIDHGDMDAVSLDDLRYLEQQFMRLPCQAVPSCLAGFENYAITDFSPDLHDRFLELALAKIFTAKRVSGGAEDGEEGQPVSLILTTTVASEGGENANAAGDDGSPTGILCINEFLKQLETAEPIHSTTPSFRTASEDGDNTSSADTSPHSKRETKTENITTIPSISNNICADGSGVLDAKIVIAFDPSDCMVQTCDKQSQYDALTTEMRTFYATQSFDDGAFEIKQGDFCALRFKPRDAVDVLWLRAYCCDVDPKSKNVITVYLVDGGDIKIVEKRDVVPLMRQFLRLPMRVFPCRLASVRSPVIGKPWPMETSVPFQQKIEGKTVKIKVRAVESDHRVYNKPPMPLIVADDMIEVASGESVTKWLLEKKLAVA